MVITMTTFCVLCSRHPSWCWRVRCDVVTVMLVLILENELCLSIIQDIGLFC